ncbi:MAG: hypothetical protein U0175_07595 [Caldilineaceae bacterium]
MTNCFVKVALECVSKNDNGAFTAHFGYNNQNREVITLAVGEKNRFTPASYLTPPPPLTP